MQLKKIMALLCRSLCEVRMGYGYGSYHVVYTVLEEEGEEGGKHLTYICTCFVRRKSEDVTRDVV